MMYSKLHVILDHQHVGKPNSPNDRGAAWALVDDEGERTVLMWETELTEMYIKSAKALLKEKKHKTTILNQGHYSTRHEEANAIARAAPDTLHIYVACHMNAGGGEYFSCFYDERSTMGMGLCRSLVTAASTERKLPVSKAIYRDATSVNAWKNAYYTIRGIYNGPANISAACLEPLFLDQKKHQGMFYQAGMDIVARVLVEGITTFYNGMRD